MPATGGTLSHPQSKLEEDYISGKLIDGNKLRGMCLQCCSNFWIFSAPKNLREKPTKINGEGNTPNKQQNLVAT